MMKFKALFVLFFMTTLYSYGQDILKDWSYEEQVAHLQFLASDELAGRDTGEPGNHVAARYLATQLQKYGVKKLPGMDTYFQPVVLNTVSPPEHTVEWNGQKFDQGESFLALSEDPYVAEMESVFANHAISEEDYEGLDVKGKLIIAQMGDGEDKSPQGAFRMRRDKIKLAKEKGALGLIEIYALQMPWGMMASYMGNARLELDLKKPDENEVVFFHGIIQMEKESIGALAAGNSGKIYIDYPGPDKVPVKSDNVLGYIEGSDPAIKDDYILLSAHYDHVGTGRRGENPDTIFNGARDNGLGTVAVLAAARTLAKNPPKRSVIFAFWTGEERGLLGSKYFAEFPPLPLNKIRFNLNSDGAGYNDTTAISVIGYNRVGVEDELKAACDQMGLSIIADPVPEQGLFDRSDNANMAAKGIPAPNFSPGLSDFDKEIGKYYHQPADSFESVNLTYVDRYYKAYILSAYMIANKKENPMWIEGDKYEKAGKELYGGK